MMTRQTRQMQLQLTTMRKWQLQKGDVSGAFLQGREYPDEAFLRPVPGNLSGHGLSRRNSYSPEASLLRSCGRTT